MNYEALAISIVKDLRQKQSQQNLSNQLGYEFNIVYRWENRKKVILWQDFFKICRLKKIPLSDVLKDFFSYVDSLEDEASLIQHLIQERSLPKLSSELNISKNILHNYIKGKTKAKLSFMLHLIDHCSLLGIEDFLERTCSPKVLNDFNPIYSLKKTYNKISIKEPRLALLLSVLCLDFYRDLDKHDDKALAQILQISEEKLKEYLTILEENQLIRFNSKKYEALDGRGVVSLQNYSDEELFEIDQFWLEEALSFFKNTPKSKRDKCRKGFFRLTFDEKTLEEFDNATLEYCKKIQEISKASSAKESIRVLNLNYFNPLNSDEIQ